MTPITMVAVTWLSFGIMVASTVGLLYLRPYVRRFLDEIHGLAVAMGEIADQVEDLRGELETLRLIAVREIEKKDVADLFGPDERESS